MVSISTGSESYHLGTVVPSDGLDDLSRGHYREHSRHQDGKIPSNCLSLKSLSPCKTIDLLGLEFIRVVHSSSRGRPSHRCEGKHIDRRSCGLSSYHGDWDGVRLCNNCEFVV
jgi:hypothetical protein